MYIHCHKSNTGWLQNQRHLEADAKLNENKTFVANSMKWLGKGWCGAGGLRNRREVAQC